MAIDQYMMSVRARLTSLSPETAETIEELRAHLEDTADGLQLAGLEPDASEYEAVRRCGAPDEIAAAITHLPGAGAARRRHSRRSVAAALVVGAALAAIGGGAVASAYTTPVHASVRHGATLPGYAGIRHGAMPAGQPARPVHQLSKEGRP